mmetsp:Transcript_73683/g.193326  ORF Transcript_73683/g.193326 Transcript_73683/m.193326 type:complete len:240 (-) Transcript_73683:137-856(-)
MTQKEDPRGGPGYSRYDNIRVITTWKDRLRKETELRHQVAEAGFHATFQMNLANASASGGVARQHHSHNRQELVTEKEHKQSPQQRMGSESALDPSSMEVQVIKHTARKPAEKWDLPATMSQDMGWLLANPVRAATMARPLRRASSTSGSLNASGQMLASSPPSPSKAMSLTTPANQFVLQRALSHPELPRGPEAPQVHKLNSRRWFRPKTSCDVTHYACAYAEAMQGVSPFSKNQPTR